MAQSITPSSGEIEVPAQRVLPSTPADQPTESVRPLIPAQASAEPVLEPVLEPLQERVPGPAGRDTVVDEAVEEPVTETPHITDWRQLTPPVEPLPDLVSALAAVPGGLGTEFDDGFVFADQEWTADDGRWDANPIGAQLAMEQSGLGYLDGYSGARHAADSPRRR